MRWLRLAAGHHLCPCLVVAVCRNAARDPWEDDDVLDADDLRAAAESLRRLLAAVEAGDVDASAAQCAHLAGAVGVLEQLVVPEGVSQTTV